MATTELESPCDMCSDAGSQDDREAWDNLSDVHTAVSTSKHQVRPPHDSDTFGLKQGRCHTCLAHLPEDAKTYSLPSTSCLNEVGLSLDAPRCDLCFGLAKAFDNFATQRPTLDERDARETWKQLKQAVSLSHQRKERNEDKILRAIEDDLDVEDAAMKKMLANCKPPKASGDKGKGKGKSEGTCNGGSRARDIALGIY
ncbi:hypothetical protein B0T14DRAFT_497866 [Immersiella caudata]|uniref:Uncharacterized protein n=1 Tax=Immersiella caudata TaxID=314043 RepID=A0AA40BX23_9PEZI|nr:hypothetical protein B0T14DRAFT_497866 [Immersiella caudata]